MPTRLKLIILFIVTTFAVIGVIRGAIKITSKDQQQQSSQQLKELEEKEKRNTLSLKERAQLAKAKGKQQILIAGTAVLYPVFQSADDLDQALLKYTVVIAEPIAKKDYMDANGAIRSWHKLKIIETISQAPLPSFVSRTVPNELLPIGVDEFVVHRTGGTMMIDGVEVTTNEQGVPTFQTSHRYLLLLSLNPTSRVGETVLGPESILPINSDNTLSPKSKESLLGSAIKARHNDSIDQLKSDLKNRSNSR